MSCPLWNLSWTASGSTCMLWFTRSRASKSFNHFSMVKFSWMPRFAQWSTLIITITSSYIVVWWLKCFINYKKIKTARITGGRTDWTARIDGGRTKSTAMGWKDCQQTCCHEIWSLWAFSSSNVFSLPFWAALLESSKCTVARQQTWVLYTYIFCFNCFNISEL